MPDFTMTDEILDRYLAGECTADEIAAVERVVSPPSADGQALSAFVASSARLGQAITPASEALRTFHARRSVKPPVVRRYSQGWRRGAAVALACTAVVVTGGIALQTTRPFSTVDPTSDSPAAMQELRTQSAQRAKFTLADGSSVVLGPNSRLRYPATFGRDTREVELDGQAMFTVTQHDAHPFVVRTGETRTRVLGTSFIVRRYQDDRVVRVVVAQGKVAVGNAVLGTGELGLTTDGVHVQVSRGVNIATEFGWVDGRLTLDEIPLRDAVPELERWYGITITVRDASLLEKRVVTTLTTESAREALSLVATALNADVTFTQGRATLSAR
jgi:transmembrane sensor